MYLIWNCLTQQESINQSSEVRCAVCARTAAQPGIRTELAEEQNLVSEQCDESLANHYSLIVKSWKNYRLRDARSYCKTGS